MDSEYWDEVLRDLILLVAVNQGLLARSMQGLNECVSMLAEELSRGNEIKKHQREMAMKTVGAGRAIIHAKRIINERIARDDIRWSELIVCIDEISNRL